MLRLSLRRACQTAATGRERAEVALLNEQRKLLIRFFNAAPEVVSSPTADAAFASVKRGQCGAIYAGQSDLGLAIQGFRRDHIAYSTVPLWFEPKQVEERTNEIRRQKERLAKEEQDLKRQRQEAEELNRRRQQHQAEQKDRREAQLQADHGPQARALSEEIASAIQVLVEGENKGNKEESWAKSQFPTFANWYRDQIVDGWEYVALDHQITNYGTADWKRRPLEVVFTDVSISMKNRLLGENKKFCFRLGLIFDTEFQKYREPFEANCGVAPELARQWSQGHGFRSQWVAE